MDESLAQGGEFSPPKDTIYVMYENTDYNEIVLSNFSKNKLGYGGDYPMDWDRKFNILIGNHLHIWFYYFVTLPENSDMVFEYHSIAQNYLDYSDFKDQEWFRNHSKNEVYELFLDNNNVIYLVEKDRISEGKAIMIRVYPDIQTIE